MTMPCSGDSREQVWTEDRDLEGEIIRVLLNNVSSCRYGILGNYFILVF